MKDKLIKALREANLYSHEATRGALFAFDYILGELNCSLDNLVLMTRAQHMVGITSSMSPERRKERTAKQVATRNETIRKDRLRIHWGLKPRTKLVKRW